MQWEAETVASYITRIERAFQIAYGHEKLTTGTRDTFLYSQFQAGLKLSQWKVLWFLGHCPINSFVWLPNRKSNDLWN